jgi:hypothetical protein
MILPLKTKIAQQDYKDKTMYSHKNFVVQTCKNKNNLITLETYIKGITKTIHFIDYIVKFAL